MDSKHNHKSNRSLRETDHYPSFSSSLLDHIYRSIDDQVMTETPTTNRKHYINNTLDAANFQRIQNWMERKTSNAANSKSAAFSVGGDFMSWSSSDSSSAGLFSSEADSNYGVSSKSSSSTTYRQKPIKTVNHDQQDKIYKSGTQNHEPGGGGGGGGGVVKRSKLKALKMYGDSLKKVKQQPISPGAKLASFLNSIFTNAKKGKIGGSNSSNTSPACSTSRSCLSKTGKLSNNGTKRSVRFDPVSEIVDEDRVHKYLSAGMSYKNEESKLHKKNSDESVEEAAREMLRNYQRKVELQQMMDDDDDDDDDNSCGSSDLFELDSLNNKYMEELPVYETTYVDTNRAIAHGLLV